MAPLIAMLITSRTSFTLLSDRGKPYWLRMFIMLCVCDETEYLYICTVNMKRFILRRLANLFTSPTIPTLRSRCASYCFVIHSHEQLCRIHATTPAVFQVDSVGEHKVARTSVLTFKAFVACVDPFWKMCSRSLTAFTTCEVIVLK